MNVDRWWKKSEFREVDGEEGHTELQDHVREAQFSRSWMPHLPATEILPLSRRLKISKLGTQPDITKNLFTDHLIDLKR